MTDRRVRIADIAQELGLSTATVSNVIHGKKHKVSEETLHRVQAALEQRQYVPSMAGILLAQNDSRILGVVINDHEKYASHALEDAFIAASISCLSAAMEKAGYFMMIKIAKEWRAIEKFASMWNMDGLILIGFCEQDYKTMREQIRIPIVVYDGFFQERSRICNLTVDNYGGGYQVGAYFRSLGHQRALCIADNEVCMDLERYWGFRAGMADGTGDFLKIPMDKEMRQKFYMENLDKIQAYSAVFAVSDYYAIDLMHFLQAQGLQIPRDMSIVGFDDVSLCEMVTPALTTVRQSGELRAELAVSMLLEMREQRDSGRSCMLPVTLVKRQSAGPAANVQIE